MSATILTGDCRVVLASMPEDSVHSCVTDPPYGLKFMGKAWDYDVPPVETWREVLRVLKPGGHLLAFGGTRTYHRMVVAIEDAGFEIRDTCAWLYGSGFPKSHDVSKGIDAAAGAKREVVGISARHGSKAWSRDFADGQSGFKSTEEGGNVVTAPATAAARQWEGWGTALKPAMELIVVARKPLSAGTVAANVMQHGTGALNIDGCRIATDENRARNNAARTTGTSFIVQREARFIDPGGVGRWPANVITDGSEEVLAGFPFSASGKGAIKKQSAADTGGNKGAAFGAESRPAGTPMICHGDSGSAARFFYCSKASKADRDEGLTNAEQPIVTFATANGTSGKPSSISEGRNTAYRNNHPCVKPTDLMRYLCRLVTPPGGTVLDPFMGSGSTGKAARLEQFSFIGIEIDPAYVEIARARIDGDAPLFAEAVA